jgi:RHS repeat-associated protein
LAQAVIGAVTTTYAYDHAGQRVKYGNGTTTTLYPSKNYNIEGTNQVKHIFAGDQVVATVKGTGATAAVFSVHTDHLSGSSAVTNSSGVQEEVMDYFPFGEIRLDQKTGTFDEQRKFSGHEYDAETELTYMNARYYKSDIGRFVSQDPVFLTVSSNLMDPQSLNAYAYSRNNPLRYVDPSGQSWVDYAHGGGGYIIGLGQGMWTVGKGTVNTVIHPIQTLQNQVNFYADTARQGADLVSDLVNDTSQTVSEIKQGTVIGYNEFMDKTPFEQGKSIGNAFGIIEGGIIVSYGLNKGVHALNAPKLSPMPKGVDNTLKRIGRGEFHPHKNDGSIFENRPINGTSPLPGQAHGYYREYVHPTPGNDGAGIQRVVVGQQGETYYSPDHYKSFQRIK